MVLKKNKGKNYLIIAVFIFFGLILPNSYAIDFYVPQSENYDINVGCSINGANCASSASCNVTVVSPNSSILVDNKALTNLNNGLFNYTLNVNETSTKGEHSGKAFCSENGKNATTAFNYEVNPAGIRSSESRTETITRSIYSMFIIGILAFVAFMFNNSPPIKWTFFILSIIFLLIGVNIILVGIQDEIINPKLENLFDGITAISFIAYWFLAGILALMWFFTFINTWILRKNERMLRKFG